MHSSQTRAHLFWKKRGEPIAISYAENWWIVLATGAKFVAILIFLSHLNRKSGTFPRVSHVLYICVSQAKALESHPGTPRGAFSCPICLHLTVAQNLLTLGDIIDSTNAEATNSLTFYEFSKQRFSCQILHCENQGVLGQNSFRVSVQLWISGFGSARNWS